KNKFFNSRNQDFPVLHIMNNINIICRQCKNIHYFSKLNIISKNFASDKIMNKKMISRKIYRIFTADKNFLIKKNPDIIFTIKVYKLNNEKIFNTFYIFNNKLFFIPEKIDINFSEFKEAIGKIRKRSYSYKSFIAINRINFGNQEVINQDLKIIL